MDVEKKEGLLFVKDVSKKLGIDEQFIVHCIDTQWVIPTSRNRMQEPMLDDEDIARIQLIYELQSDLGANDESIGIILHLLDQLYHLRLQVAKLRRAA